ncbi:MAG: DUF2017 family protein [Verrucomicrobia subdivision 3 bacterium]|nr:DUF2017 family protein [Limisphaerales bacterium]
MKAGRENDRIVLSFALLEVEMLRRALSSIIRNYRIKPAEINPRVAGAWYSTRGCAAAGMTDEQTREWIETLHEMKTANLDALRGWRRKLVPAPGKSARLELTDEEAHTLMIALNDHRLMRAARYDLGEEEMNVRTLTQFMSLKPRRQAALVEISFLAGIIEAILALLPGNYGDWTVYAQ